MLDKLGLNKATAFTIIQLYMAACYLTPLLGAQISDRWLGRYNTIMSMTVPYVIGIVVVAIFQDTTSLIVGLSFLALAAGGMKPNLTPLMGAMYEKEGKDKATTDQAFSWYYVAINIGAALSMFGLPIVRDRFGYSAAFLSLAPILLVSMILFGLGKRYYHDEKPQRGFDLRSDAEKAKDRRTLFNIGQVFILISFFWCIFDQSASTWTDFAKEHMTLKVFGLNIAPDAVQGTNSIWILILTPVMIWIWEKINSKRANPVSSTKKMLVGFLLCAACMAIMAVAGYFAQAGKVAIWWQVGAYALITAAELCVSVVGMQFAFTQAPARLKSTVTGMFWLTVFIGDLIGERASNFYTKVEPSVFFAVSTVVMLGIAMIFSLVSRQFEKRSNSTSTITPVAVTS
jgi:POT family proton-dependent oligopeptide transporter